MLTKWLRGKRTTRRNAAADRPTRVRLGGFEPLESRTVLSSFRTLGDLGFRTDGDFLADPTSGLLGTTSAVDVGVRPAAGAPFQPLLRLPGGVSLNDAAGTFTTGDVLTAIGPTQVPLFGSGKHEFSAGDLIGADESALSDKTLSVAGVNFTLSNVSLEADGVRLQGKIGVPQLAGLELAVQGDDAVVIDKSGVHLTGLDTTVSGVSFSRGGLGFALDTLHAHYSAANNEFDLSGGGSFTLGGKTVAVTLGDDTNPGVAIANGKLTRIDAALSGTLNTAGLALDVDHARLAYDAVKGTFAVSGGVSVSTPGGKLFDNVSAKLGDAAHPGLAIADGRLDALRVTVDGGFDLFGVKVAPRGLTLDYSRAKGQVALTGGLTVEPTPLFSFATDLPDGGVTIDTGTGAVALHDLTFTTTLDFKAVKVENAKFSYASDGHGGYTVSAGGTVTVGQVGLTGNVVFSGGRVTMVDFAYEQSPGIPIGDTGAYVTRVAGKVDNLDKPRSTEITLQGEVIYGKKVRFLGHDYALFVADGTLVVSADKLHVDGTVEVVGGLLGTGHIVADANFAKKEISGHLDVSMYDDVFKYGVDLKVNQYGDAVADGHASINLPKLPKAIRDLASFLPTSALASANVHLEIHPGSPVGTFAEVNAKTVGGLGAKFRYDGLSGFTYGAFNGAIQTLTAAVDAIGDTVTKSYDALGNSVEGWVGHTGQTWQRVTQSFVPGQWGRSIVTEYSNGVRYLRNTLQFGQVTLSESWDAAWNAGAAEGKYVIQVFGSSARTITTTLKAGGERVRETVYATGKRVWESIDSAGDVAETWVKDEAGSAWKKTKNVFDHLKFW